MKHTHNHWWIRVLLVVAFTLSGGLTLAQDTYICGTDSGTGCAPQSQLVDLAIPSFSDPTTVTNPLFPISDLHRVLLLGTVDGLPFRTETTLLPGTKVIDWNGQPVETLVSQYMAFLNGRLEEVAIDRYAQSDDGAVWYLGEDVADYKDGAVISTEGTWLAGKEAPPAMIMPGSPQVGNAFRPENAPGIVFEEVTVKAIDQTVRGPFGAVQGAILTDELHTDGTHEGKVFAPGYGEFITGSGGTLEALALAIPADAIGEPLPAEPQILSNGAADIFNAAESGDWGAVSASLDTTLAAWDAYRKGSVPETLESTMSLALTQLVAAVNAQQPIESRQAAINVARSSFDLQLPYRPVVEIDIGLFDLWAAQILVDAAAGEPGGVTNDVTTLEWVWDRLAHTLDSTSVSAIEAQLAALRTAADAADLASAANTAQQLRDVISTLTTATA